MSDAETLARIVEEDGLQAGELDLGVVRWGSDVLRVTLERLLGRFDPELQADERLVWVAYGIGAVLLVWILATLLWNARLLLRRRHAEINPAVATPTPAPSPRDRRRAIEALLAAGRAREAVAELWPWIAGHLAARGVGVDEPDRTIREFVASVAADRPELPRLRRLAGEVERLAWAGGALSVGDVRAVLAEAEAL